MSLNDFPCSFRTRIDGVADPLAVTHLTFDELGDKRLVVERLSEQGRAASAMANTLGQTVVLEIYDRDGVEHPAGTWVELVRAAPRDRSS